MAFDLILQNNASKEVFVLQGLINESPTNLYLQFEGVDMPVGLQEGEYTYFCIRNDRPRGNMTINFNDITSSITSTYLIDSNDVQRGGFRKAGNDYEYYDYQQDRRYSLDTLLEWTNCGGVFVKADNNSAYIIGRTAEGYSIKPRFENNPYTIAYGAKYETNPIAYKTIVHTEDGDAILKDLKPLTGLLRVGKVETEKNAPIAPKTKNNDTIYYKR